MYTKFTVFAILPPDLGHSASPYARFIRHYQFSFVERLALILSLIPHIRPQLLDVFFTKNKTFDREFSEFGGMQNGPESDFLPTGETLAFVVAGANLEARFAMQALFSCDHVFAKHAILRAPGGLPDQTLMEAPLQLSEEYVGYFTTGQARRPDFGVNFPARYIETQLDWGDLVLHPGTHRQIEEIAMWIRRGDTLMRDWGMAAKLLGGAMETP